MWQDRGKTGQDGATGAKLWLSGKGTVYIKGLSTIAIEKKCKWKSWKTREFSEIPVLLNVCTPVRCLECESSLHLIVLLFLYIGEIENVQGNNKIGKIPRNYHHRTRTPHSKLFETRRTSRCRLRPIAMRRSVAYQRNIAASCNASDSRLHPARFQ